jgi:exodeoxyribonuclease-5
MATIPVTQKPKAPDIFTKHQKKAWDILVDFLDPSNKEQVCIIEGHAGTGKSTLIVELAMAYPSLLLCAPTAKAAYVLTRKMRQKGSSLTATTIHERLKNLVGEEFDRDTGRTNPLFEDKTVNLRGKVLVFDEASMVNQNLHDTAVDTQAKVVLVGDPFQLSPVEGKRFKGVANFTLKQVTRQAKGNSIVRQAGNVRRGLKYGNDGEHVRVWKALGKNQELPDRVLLWADVVICHNNLTRHSLNARIRKLKGLPEGYEKKVVAGETVVALKNCHEYGIFNNSTYKVTRDFDVTEDRVIHLEREDGSTVIVPKVRFVPKGGNKYSFSKEERKALNCIFDYAYCLTCHAAQGSEWPRVLLINDYWVPYAKRKGNYAREARKWLYTGMTRAVTDLRVLRGENEYYDEETPTDGDEEDGGLPG